MEKNTVLNLKYSTIQIFYFAIFSSLIGYASVYLLDKGFSNSQIGFTLAMASVCSVFLQPMVASFVDKHKSLSLNKVIITAVLLAVILSTVLLFIPNGNIAIQIVFVLVVVIAMTLQPLVNTLAFSFEKFGISLNFGVARGIGSAAYAVSSFLIGQLLGVFSPNFLPIYYIIAAIGLIVVMYFFTLPKNTKAINDAKNDDVYEELTLLQFFGKYKKFMFFILGATLLFFDHMLINNFFIQIITPVGGNENSMGTAIFLAAILELPAMALFTRYQKHLSCATLLKISAIFFMAKHLLTFVAPSMMFIYIAQAMQMFAYALFIPASVYYVQQKMEKGDITKGQAMATGAVSLASVFASLSGGVLLDTIGVTNVLLLGVILSAIGLLIVLFTVDNKSLD